MCYAACCCSSKRACNRAKQPGKKPLSIFTIYTRTHVHHGLHAARHASVWCVCRPVPTPNWRAPRPLTPPPTPVQQGHPLSAPPAQKAYLQTSPGQQGPPAADSPELSQDSAAVSPASVRGPISREDAPTSDATETVTAGYALTLHPLY